MARGYYVHRGDQNNDNPWDHTNTHSEDVHAGRRRDAANAKSASKHAATTARQRIQDHALAQSSKVIKKREKAEAKAKAKAVKGVLKIQADTIRRARRTANAQARANRKARVAARKAARAARKRR